MIQESESAKLTHADIPALTPMKLWWWSKWHDYTCGNYGGSGFVLQVRRSRTGALDFRIRWLGGALQVNVPYGAGTRIQ